MKQLSRRRFVVLTPWVPLALACEKESAGGTCAEPAPSALSEEQKKLRKGVAYVHGGAPADKACAKCLYFKAAEGCGSCEVMPGPVAPQGTCQLFREKT